MKFPKIMGILNATPDSFSDGNGEININALFDKAKNMVNNEVDIIDIGGETTKPGADDTPVNIELERIIPILKLIKSNFPTLPVSIDTRKAEVAEETLKLGADIINDVSGLQYEPEIANITARYNATLIIMHSKHSPKTMQINPSYNDVVKEVFDFLQNQITFAQKQGVEKIIADIGIGFAKTTEHNIELLKNIDYFAALNIPLLLGISRKRFIGEIINIAIPQDRDIATMLIHSLLLKYSNIEIIRVHNIELAKQFKRVATYI